MKRTGLTRRTPLRASSTRSSVDEAEASRRREKRAQRSAELDSGKDPGDRREDPRGNSIQRRKALPAKSAKTAERDREYSALRRVFLGGPCRARLPVCSGPATEVHHMKGRGLRVMLDVSTWAGLCSECHRYVTEHPEDGRRLGLLFRTRDEVPAMAAYGLCKSCHSPIYWAKTEDRKSIPLDADPDTELPLSVEDNGKAGRIQERHRVYGLGLELRDIVVKVSGAGVEVDPELQVWRSHFATCSQAGKHRRRK